ncbi:carboxyl transferase domain-containing protein [Aeromicrobium halocynthiae]|uniref:acetyl-CoA carboxylase n=1 Tax=Aeromicrobium halocynthiae TaxID=560557 RepID=A0ABP5HLU4_9ACTN
MKVLIANRGEIAVRIERAVTALDWTVQHVHVEGEDASPESALLARAGVDGYLDVDEIVRAARESGSDVVHPGYGFLSETAELSRACLEAGLIFVGPAPEVLELFGDKASARAHAVRSGVPVLAATSTLDSPEDARELLVDSPDGIMVKAVAGGGGRGIRVVRRLEELDEAIDRCRSEAGRAFGHSAVYAERMMTHAKHIEVQVIGDGTGAVATLGERECSIQRRHQKLIEVAPSPALSEEQRAVLEGHAERLVAPLDYRGLATVEFLVDARSLHRGPQFDHAFIEVNPRLQVEHTVTEQVTDVDLVVAQLRIAVGDSLQQIRLDRPRTGVYAIQSRVNAERQHRGTVSATTGTVTRVDLPEGARVDTHVFDGLVVDRTFDPLLAKVVTTTTGDFAEAAADAAAALEALSIDGVETNRAELLRILAHPTFAAGMATTDFVDDAMARTVETIAEHSGSVSAVTAGTVVAVHVGPGDRLDPRTPIVTLEAMKMEHTVTAGHACVLESLAVGIGQTVLEGQLIADVRASEHAHTTDGEVAAVDLNHIRPDLAELRERRELTLDAARPTAVAKRHARGHLTAREQVARLTDKDSFVEYGSLPVAAQRSRRDLDDLIRSTPADGIVTGLARVDGTEVAVLAYDYTVLAGTQGYFNHKKTDRLLHVARSRRLPVVFFTEGGGGRPGDTDTVDTIAAGLNVTTFAMFASLSGLVPTIGILTGRCFAGNAALLGCCDVVIATADSNLGMAGPAMIEGGGLGRFSPEEIGPMDIQSANGVVDVVVENDDDAIATATSYLSFFSDKSTAWTVADQRRLRHVIGENRKVVYDIREVVRLIADEDSVLELRTDFGIGAVTALVRVEGRSMGLIANDPRHLGGAIDVDAADKMARFLQLCDAHGLPVISLCDTPGFMVGPEAERAATVRHVSRLFVIGSHLSVPMITIVLRKGYGLGAQAMAAGGFAQTLATVAWPTGEIGGMGLEGAVRLGYAKELGAIEDDAARERRYTELLDAHYDTGRAINGAMKHELDEVIDPSESRTWIMATVGSMDTAVDRPRRTFIDTW